MGDAIKRVYLKTLGCDKNTVDSQEMIAQLAHASYVMTDDPALAEVIIVNTCCFIESAKNESIDAIFDCVPYRTGGRCTSLIVAGCMAQRYAQELAGEIPEIDHFIGVNNLQDLLTVVDEAEAPAILTDGEAEGYVEAREGRLVEPGTVTAYLKIAEGCDKHCTYCAIPAIRGHYRSRKPQAVLDEARALYDQGVRELILIAQDLTQYGHDLAEKTDLAALLDELAALDFTWIRLLYLYPEGIDDRLLDVVAAHPNICRYFDMPIQHTEDSILRRMGRQIDGRGIRDNVALIRRRLPDVFLRTTIITGFPGETEEEFQGLLKSLAELRFERLGAFAYSREEGTPAASMEGQLPEDVKEQRRRQVYEQQAQITSAANERMVGETVTVLVEEVEEGIAYGRTRGDAPEIDCAVILDSQDYIIGRFYAIKITRALGYDLLGERQNEFTQ